MMVKSGAIKIIFKSHDPFQSYLLTGQSNSAKKANSERAGGIKNYLNGTTFHHHFCVKIGLKCPEEFLCYFLAPETYSVTFL